ncbi:unnamed protein product [marine sediment metagenome]|uniref:Uncharacterized protein n=1 Tax=marine sediment metagenome TaxID=412755 RepID=X0YCQ3_9ZZZZ
MALFFIYVFSFVQTKRESSAMLQAKKNALRNEIKWKCHSARMTFWRWVKINFWSLFGIQTDEDGYTLTEECKDKIIELENKGDSLADIFYKTLIRPKMTIIKEIFSSVYWLDKIFISSLIAFVLFLKYLFFKKKNGDNHIQQKNDKTEVGSKCKSR